MSASPRLDEFQEIALLVLAYGGAKVGETTRGGTPDFRELDADLAALLALQGLAQRKGDEVHLTDAGLETVRRTFPDQALRAPMYS